MKQNKLLELMFAHETWEKMIETANEKELNTTIVKRFCDPNERVRLYTMFVTEQIESPPTYAREIPKDEPGKFRTVHIAETEYRVIFALINHCLFQLFPDMVHKQCKSYKTGESCSKTVLEVSDVLIKLNKNKNKYRNKYNKTRPIGKKFDFSKYFDNVSLDAILAVFDEIEKRLGFEFGTEPVMNFLRKFYKSNWLFDLDGNLVEMYVGLKQGVAVSSFLADAILYELDDYMDKKYKGCYWRYSDDLLCFAKNTKEIEDDIVRIISKYGVVLNKRKTKDVYLNRPFKFLGFDLCKDKVTLSERRINTFTKEIVRLTIAKPFITPNDAKKNIRRYLYGNGDGYSWATSCFAGLRNCDDDIMVLNNFVMDAIRICEVRYKYNQERIKQGKIPKRIEYGFQHIGGIGVEKTQYGHKLIRGTGIKVKNGIKRTEKEIKYYYSIGCLLKDYRLGKSIYETAVRSMCM